MSRVIEKEVFIEATPDAVWQALTDADVITRWFPVHARIEGGEEGSIWLSWGAGTEGRAPITSWEPERRFGWTETRGQVKLAVEFDLEPREGGTLVRLVQSGFGDGPDWDAEYHMTEGGWGYFLEHLRFYLERHRGVPRDLVVFRELIPISPTEAFLRLTHALGLAPKGPASIPAVGETFNIVAADGLPLSGRVVSLEADTGQVGVTIDDLDEAILFVEMEPGRDGCRAGFWLSTYGLRPSALAKARTRFGRLYTRSLNLV